MSSNTHVAAVGAVKKKVQHLKDQIDTLETQLESREKEIVLLKEEKDTADAEVTSLSNRLQLLQDNFENTEERLTQVTAKLEEASHAADESERGRKALENRQITDDDKIECLEQLCKEASEQCAEAERKYDEAARKLAITEVDLERAEARLEAAEASNKELTEELDVNTNALKSVEIREGQASQREDTYEETIRDLTAKLKEAEGRAQEGERQSQKLQKEVDRLEDSLEQEREARINLQQEYESTVSELTDI